MATNTSWVDNENQYTVESTGYNKFIAEVDVDFSLYTIENATDTIECLKVPKGAHVTRVGLYVKSASTAAADALTCGDGADPNGWTTASLDLDSAGGALVSPAGAGYPTAGGKLYTAADTIDIVLATAIPTDGVLTVWAEYSIVQAAANA